MALKRLSQVEDTSGLKYEMDYPNITGFDVFDINGNDVGEVQDLVVDTATGLVHRAIVGRGWLASILGERQVIVPFNRMTVNPSERSIRLDISRNELSSFPEWSDVSQEGLRERIENWWEQRRKAA